MRSSRPIDEIMTNGPLNLLEGDIKIPPGASPLEALVHAFKVEVDLEITDQGAGSLVPILRSIIEKIEWIIVAKVRSFHDFSHDEWAGTIDLIQGYINDILQYKLSELSLGHRAVLEVQAVILYTNLAYINWALLACLGRDNYIKALGRAGIVDPDTHIPFSDDFIGMQETVLQDERYQLVRECVRLEPAGLVPLRPIDEIPGDFWGLFRAAQEDFLRLKNKHSVYRFEDDDTIIQREWGIYPRIQAFSTLDSQIIHCSRVGRDGRVEVRSISGWHGLPGGSREELDSADDLCWYAPELAFDQVIKTQCPDLFLHIAEELDSADFCVVRIINRVCQWGVYRQLPDVSEVTDCLQTLCGGAALKKAISQVDNLLSRHPLNAADFTALRASLQLSVFEQMPTYGDLLMKYIDQSSLVVYPILQVCDTRGMVSRQTALTVIAKDHPLSLIEERYPSLPTEQAAGGLNESFVSPLELIARDAHCLDVLPVLWSSWMQTYDEARGVLLSDEALNDAYQKLATTCEAVMAASAFYRALGDPSQASLYQSVFGDASLVPSYDPPPYTYAS